MLYLHWNNIQNLLLEHRKQFFNDLNNFKIIQQDVMLDIINRNTHSDFGHKHYFSHIKNYNDFSVAVPISKYEQLNEYSYKGLCFEPSIGYKLTGGSTNGSKKIYLNESSIKAYQNPISIWLNDLIENYPQLKFGKIYWSISPNMNKFSEDSPLSDFIFFDPNILNSLQHITIGNESLSNISDLDEWAVETAYLLLTDKVSLFSVWSPTFLLELIELIRINHVFIIQKLLLNGYHDIAQMVTDFGLNKIEVNQLFPHLKVISCWADGESKYFSDKLQSLFPSVVIQGKGLISTESFMTLPLYCINNKSILSPRSNFYEFIDNNNNILLPHQLIEGEKYKIIITTYNGLYRYDIGDIVICHGFHNEVPLLKFVGRTEGVSDLVGEKISDDFLSHIPEDFILIPIKEKQKYICISEKEFPINDILMKNNQYKYAVGIGQLKPTEHFLVKNLLKNVIDYELSKNKILGEIKVSKIYKDEKILDYLGIQND